MSCPRGQMAPDKVPSSGIGAACQSHKEQYLHSAFSTLFCPILTALQVILSELQSLLEEHHQLLSKEVVNICLFGQNSVAFHLRNLRSRFLSPFDNGFPKLDNGSTSRLDFSTLECVRGRQTLNVSLRAPENTVVKSTVPSLSCRDRRGSCRDWPFSKAN